MALLPPDPVYVIRSSDKTGFTSISFQNNEKLLGSTTKGKIQLFDLETNRSSNVLEVQDSSSILSIYSNEKILYTQEKFGCVKKWVLSNSGYFCQTQTKTNHAAFCKMFIHSNILLIPKDDNTICILDKNTFSEINSLVVPETKKFGLLSAIKVVVKNSTTYVMASYENGDLCIWDLQKLEMISSTNFENMITSFDYNADSNKGICGSSDKMFYEITINNSIIKCTSKIQIKNNGTEVVRIRRDNKIFVLGGSDSRIRLYSCKSSRPLAVLTEHKTGGISDIAFSNGIVKNWNSPIMAVSGFDGIISLWDVYN